MKKRTLAALCISLAAAGLAGCGGGGSSEAPKADGGQTQADILWSGTIGTCLLYTSQEEIVKASYKLDSTEHVKERLKAGE